MITTERYQSHGIKGTVTVLLPSRTAGDTHDLPATLSSWSPTTHLGLEILLQQGLHLGILLLQRVVLHQQLGPLGQHEAGGEAEEAG